jgi:hypothetical protein
MYEARSLMRWHDSDEAVPVPLNHEEARIAVRRQ